jgi:hypothetical protein
VGADRRLGQLQRPYRVADAGPDAGPVPLQALLAAAEERGFRKLLSRIFPENAGSLARHRKVGFRDIGIYRRHGKLDGEWRDCVIVEKLLGDAGDDREQGSFAGGRRRPNPTTLVRLLRA